MFQVELSSESFLYPMAGKIFFPRSMINLLSKQNISCLDFTCSSWNFYCFHNVKTIPTDEISCKIQH